MIEGGYFMKKVKSLLVILLVFLILLSACSSKKEDSSIEQAAGALDVAEEAMPEGKVATIDSGGTEEYGVADGASKEATSTDTDIKVDSGRRLIRTIDITSETQEFDKMYQTVEAEISKMSGYIESANVTGGATSGTNRNGRMVIRIPSDKLDQFIDSISVAGNVISKNESTQDITLEYVDMESHKKALQVEYDRLLTILEKADTLDQIIALETRMTDVRYELQSYESQLRTYDNLVDYGTVTINIIEVERMTAVHNESTFDKMRNGISKSFYDIGQGLKGLVIDLVTNLPYLIILIVVGIISFIIYKKWKKKVRKKNEVKLEEMHKKMVTLPEEKEKE